MDFLTLTAHDGATARICTQGAHLCSWIPAGGTEQLFLSKTSAFAEGVAIRGGVPVIFPQFAGLGALPKHGFARTAPWRLLHSGHSDSGAAHAEFELRENIARLMVWPHVFRAVLGISLHDNVLQIELTIENTGDTTFSFTGALHTYLAVRDLAATTVHGLQGTRYRDCVSRTSDLLEQAPDLSISGETDRIYADTPALLEVRQPHARLRLHQSGFPDTVVWNPGATAGAQLADLEADGYARMLCVEAAAVMRPVVLAPGECWCGSQALEAISQGG